LKALNPLVFLVLFFDVTALLPILTTGARIAAIWYTPMATTGQASFIEPFEEFVAVCVVVNVVAFLLLRRLDWGRFIALDAEIGMRSILRGVLSDAFGRSIVLAFIPVYLLSYLISSGLLLVPNVNISSYFIPVTRAMYQGAGVPLVGPLALNFDILAVGLADLLMLTVALAFGYYVVSLLYVSQASSGLGVPGSMRMMATQTAGGFLATSVPALATSAAICCLTPTGVNSLLYLVSTSTSLLSKKVIFGYGTVAGVFWVTGLLQGIELFSTTILGVALLGLSFYQVRKIANAVAQRRVLTLQP
jgi:hypothetical protein